MNVRIPVEASVSIVGDYPVSNPPNRDALTVSYECATHVHVRMHALTALCLLYANESHVIPIADDYNC